MWFCAGGETWRPPLDGGGGRGGEGGGHGSSKRGGVGRNMGRCEAGGVKQQRSVWEDGGKTGWWLVKREARGEVRQWRRANAGENRSVRGKAEMCEPVIFWRDCKTSKRSGFFRASYVFWKTPDLTNLELLV